MEINHILLYGWRASTAARQPVAFQDSDGATSAHAPSGRAAAARVPGRSSTRTASSDSESRPRPGPRPWSTRGPGSARRCCQSRCSAAPWRRQGESCYEGEPRVLQRTPPGPSSGPPGASSVTPRDPGRALPADRVPMQAARLGARAPSEQDRTPPPCVPADFYWPGPEPVGGAGGILFVTPVTAKSNIRDGPRRKWPWVASLGPGRLSFPAVISAA
jgi:hypothetical protein